MASDLGIGDVMKIGLEVFRSLPEETQEAIEAEVKRLAGQVAAALVHAIVFRGGPYSDVYTTDEARQRAHDEALAHARIAAANVIARKANSVDTDEARGLR